MDAMSDLTIATAQDKEVGHSASTTTKIQVSSALLQIPPEIRDAIYSHLFDLCQLPGDPKAIYPDFDPSPSPKGESVTTCKHGRCRISYQTALPKYQLLPILQTCQQIRSEFQGFLRRTLNGAGKTAASQGKGLRYELDVAGYILLLYPVWSALPLPPEEPYNMIEELRVNYQVRDYRKPGGRFYACGGPGSESHNLFHLLSDFLFHGPQGFYLPAVNDLEPRNGEEGPRFEGGRCNPKVKHLILNVCFESKNKRIEEAEASVESGEPGAEAALEEAHVRFVNQKAEASGWILQHIATLVDAGYFDGYVEKISVFHEGLELWKRRDWDLEDPPETHSIIIDQGFDRAPDWKQDEEFVRYGFIWGPQSTLQRSTKLEQDAGA
ncbi:hypothetical protein TWF281_011589 [Arthrobotrys megalospora]